MTIFNNKLSSKSLEIFPAIAGNGPWFSFEKPAIAPFFFLRKFWTIGLVPCGTPCYNWELAETFSKCSPKTKTSAVQIFLLQALSLG